MTHDADKLIRQLSLVAYLMAEQRPITARDVKTNVEGYSNMGDEAFARRFFADRTELKGLGVPITSNRDTSSSGIRRSPARVKTTDGSDMSHLQHIGYRPVAPAGREQGRLGENIGRAEQQKAARAQRLLQHAMHVAPRRCAHGVACCLCACRI